MATLIENLRTTTAKVRAEREQAEEKRYTDYIDNVLSAKFMELASKGRNGTPTEEPIELPVEYKPGIMCKYLTDLGFKAMPLGEITQKISVRW